MNLEIDYGSVGSTPSLTRTIVALATKLQKFDDSITSCRVSIDAGHRRRQGNAFRVHIRLAVAGAEIAASRDANSAAHADASVALRDAFDAARRQLEDHARRRRGDVKQHSKPIVRSAA
jgi:ribosome-associated translation inhibitor RaiA